MKQLSATNTFTVHLASVLTIVLASGAAALAADNDNAPATPQQLEEFRQKLDQYEAATAEAMATRITAKMVMEQMPAAIRPWYLEGLLDGIAYARYLDHDRDAKSMSCVYRLYDADGSTGQIEQTLQKFPDYTPASILAAMAGKECEN